MTMKSILNVFSLGVVIFLGGCGFYTFSGSTLPPYLETVDVPLFVNQSLQPGVAEDVTTEVISLVRRTNLLDNVLERGDATLTGTVVNYVNEPYTYNTPGARQVDVEQYAVKITVEVIFLDNKQNEPLYEGAIVGEGIYDFDTETEETGRRKAIQDIAEQIMQNSVQSW